MKWTGSGFWGGYGRGRGWGGMGPWNEASSNDPVLERIPSGRKVRVKYILGGWSANSRLASMGIIQGAEIEVIKNDLNYPWTPIIVKVNGVEIALGRGIASRVIVEFIE